MKIVFATHNKNKLVEVKSQVPSHIEIVSLDDINCFDEIPETASTLEGNASLKASFVSEKFNIPCFSDDTGLLVDYLNGAPGVLSARYAGEEKDDELNMARLLNELPLNANRNAHFKTVVALHINGKELFFEGIVQGEITKTKRGEHGFGYDPIFQPKGYTKTFAELSLKTKKEIGHRGKAISKLITYLNQL